MTYTLGIDYGSNAVRIVALDYATGEIVVSASQDYSDGEKGVLLDAHNVHLARQNATDYVDSLCKCFEQLQERAKEKGVDLNHVKSIGVDATGSTPIPVTKDLLPVSALEGFENNLSAKAWMWKDHTSEEEAKAITDVFRENAPEFLKYCGGKYSSEWFWAKILKCLHTDEEVFDKAHTWVEFSDYIPAVLSGVKDADLVKRNVCAAGHKALYVESLGGFPNRELIENIDPRLEKIRAGLPQKLSCADEVIGTLSKEWADRWGLNEDVKIAAGALDAHVGAIGSGVNQETLVKVVGTSSCDIIVGDKNLQDIQGISGIAQDSVIPGFNGIEAGQSAVGDIFKWYVEKHLKQSPAYHGELTEKAAALRPGQSGLIALDWQNGNRNILLDANLTGMILGMSLYTEDHEVYRALLEASAFGALKIIDRLEQSGVGIKKIICSGGIPQKNPLFMQIFADVFNRTIYVSQNDENVAYGAAIIAASTLTDENGQRKSILELQQQYIKESSLVYEPIESNVKLYKELYALYSSLHDAFGSKEENGNMFEIMKKLLEIKKKAKPCTQEVAV
ncbi:MAG: ribulokinase [Cytophagales bacterium]|nr:ribulokinase [Cytophagales bacterium]